MSNITRRFLFWMWPEIREWHKAWWTQKFKEHLDYHKNQTFGDGPPAIIIGGCR